MADERIQVGPMLTAADLFFRTAERDVERSRREVEPIRVELTKAAREEGQKALGQMKTIRVGRTRKLTVTTENRKRIDRASAAQEQRFSRFRLQWLDQGQVRRLISKGWEEADQREFFRHSNRLARNARLFLERIGELEPSLKEEADATINQMRDARNDLLKLEVRSFTQLAETLERNLVGRSDRPAAGEDIRAIDLDRNLFNLSLLAHPQGVVRELFANASQRMAARISDTEEQAGERSLFFVGAGPEAVKKMTKGSRAAGLMFRVFTARELDDRYRKLNAGRSTTSNWRTLGLAHNTNEWYVPIPPELEDEVRQEMRKRRAEFLASLEIRE